MNKDKLTFHLGISICRNEHSFGPGVAKIMDLVKQTGSLSKAYDIMGLSSSKGWKILKQSEESLGFPLIISKIGGSGGGNSKLSEEGERLLEKYYQFVNEVNENANISFNKYFEEYNGRKI